MFLRVQHIFYFSACVASTSGQCFYFTAVEGFGWLMWHMLRVMEAANLLHRSSDSGGLLLSQKIPCFLHQRRRENPPPLRSQEWSIPRLYSPDVLFNTHLSASLHDFSRITSWPWGWPSPIWLSDIVCARQPTWAFGFHKQSLLKPEGFQTSGQLSTKTQTSENP